MCRRRPINNRCRLDSNTRSYSALNRNSWVGTAEMVSQVRDRVFRRIYDIIYTPPTTCELVNYNISKLESK